MRTADIDDAAALICSDAAQFYREHPELWLQCCLREGDRRCLLAAMIKAALERDVDLDPALDAISHLIPEGPGRFNDKPGRTVGEVIALLDQAAALCRSHELVMSVSSPHPRTLEDQTRHGSLSRP